MSAPRALPGGEDYPGSRLGLPASGPGAVAGWARRLLAISIDWVLSMFVVAAFVGQDVWSGDGLGQWGPLLIFFIEVSVLTTTLGGSAGQLILRVVVRRLDGQPLDPSRVLLRTFLILLVIPPLVFNRDGRGLHDLAVDSIALRSR
jgi:uncharacterized RDD family membrane protein YckC